MVADELFAYSGLMAPFYTNMSFAHLRLARALRAVAPGEADRVHARGIEVFQAGRKLHPASQELLSFEKRELNAESPAASVQ